LGEGHAQELIQAGELLDLVAASVSPDAPAELMERQEFHHLREQRLPGIHWLLLS
jgi:hypothetical protein